MGSGPPTTIQRISSMANVWIMSGFVIVLVTNHNTSCNSPRTVSTGWLSSLLLESPVRPQSEHRIFLPRSHSLSLSLSLLSDNCSLRFNTSTSCLRWPTSSRKLSSTSLVISNMADLRTVSMTTESWDWNVRKRVSDIVLLSPWGRPDAMKIITLKWHKDL